MERIDLATMVSQYEVGFLHLNWSGRVIEIQLISPGGSTLRFVYVEAEAETLMVALNKANLSTKSLHRRIMEKLIADGKIAGTISGIPK